MYGWFDTSLCIARTWFAAPDERCLRITPAEFIQWLPLLGSVLYVPARRQDGGGVQQPYGVLCEDPLLKPLLYTRYLRVRGNVSADGPREWIECLDARGETLAQLHLLPDTDYLAWDNLPSGSTVTENVPRHLAAYRFHGSAAHVMRFRCQSLANISCLGEATPPRISPLGRVIAHAIAGAHPLLMQGTPVT